MVVRVVVLTVRVGHVATDRTISGAVGQQQPESAGWEVVGRQPSEVVEVRGVEREHEVTLAEPPGRELSRTMLEVISTAPECGRASDVRALSDVPVAGSCAVDRHPIA